LGAARRGTARVAVEIAGLSQINFADNDYIGSLENGRVFQWLVFSFRH
jgi:hypothetical protein